MRFVVATNHRSGSSFFMRCLDSHPKIRASQEILRKKEDRNEDFLEEFYSTEKEGEALGFKLMYTHTNPNVWWWLLNNKNNIKVIQLVRQSLLDTALWYEAHYKGDVEGGFGPPMVVKGKVEAIIPSVLETAERILSDIWEWRKFADLRISYEKDLTNNGQGVDQFYNEETRKEMLEEFFGVEDRPLADVETRQKKNKRPPNEEVITNFDELKLAFEREGIPLWLEM